MNDEEVIYFNQYEGFKFMEFLDHVPLSLHQSSFESDSNLFFGSPRYDCIEYKGIWKIKQILQNCSKEFYDEIKLKQNFSSERWRTTIKIVETNEKISFKVFWFFSEKKFGRPYFKVLTECRFVTYNKKKKLFYNGGLYNYHKKRNFIKKIRVLQLNENPYFLIQNILAGFLPEDGVSDVLVSNTKNQLSCNLTKLFISRVYPDLKDGEDYETITFKKNYEVRGVKLPDNWKAFLNLYIKPLKTIKTPSLKFIEMIMKQFNLKGDKINKAFHMVKSFTNDNCIKFAINFFGEKYILSQNIDFLVSLLESPHSFSTNNYNIDFKKKEKNNILEILKLVLVNHITSLTFDDHFHMIMKLKNFEKVKWESNTLDSFTQEHFLLSEKVTFYTNGILTRFFDTNFQNITQEKIIYNNTPYFPVLLTTTFDYNQESFVQSNCVKTYINKPGSIIFSIRKGTIDSSERITIEFHLKQVNEHTLLKRVQTLGRFNQAIQSDFAEVCKEFDEKIKTFLIHNELKLPNLSLEIGGKKINSRIIFDDINKIFTYNNLQFKHLINFGPLNQIQNEFIPFEENIELVLI